MICLGTADFGTKTSREEAFHILDCYVKLGGRLIDTANVYARWGKEKENLSEQYIGSWLRERKCYNNVIVATKGGHYDLELPRISRVNEKCIRADIEESRRTLGVERIALYWVHKDNRELPVEELVDMMEGFVKEGLIERYGASNMKQDRAERARTYAKEKGYAGFCALQNRFSLAAINPGLPVWDDPGTVIPDESYLEWHTQTQTPLFAYSAIAQGYFAKQQAGTLTEPLRRTYQNEANKRTGARLAEMSKAEGLSMTALSLREMMKQPFDVIPIVAVSRAGQLEELKPLLS